MLSKTILSSAACLALACTLQAQEKCVLRGTFTDDKFCRQPGTVEKVYLNRLDAFDNPVLVDSAQVADKKFTLELPLKAGQQPEIYLLTGFDNGACAFFVEPGTVDLSINAPYPISSHAYGTPTNDLYETYKKIGGECTRIQTDSLALFHKTKGAAWIDSPEGVAARTRIGGEAKFRTHTDRLRYLLEHSDSPLAPIMMQKELLFTMDYDAANQVRQSLSPKLYDHPYYEAFSNAVLAKNINVDAELPNITMPTADGKQLSLKDFRGKFVLLDFWASWCGPCRRETPYVIKLYNKTRDLKDKFVIISFSLDNKKKNWTDAIPTMGMNLPDWVHVSGLYGWNSPAAKVLGVSAIPKTFLINPEGRLIAVDLRGDHMTQKVKELLQE